MRIFDTHPWTSWGNDCLSPKIHYNLVPQPTMKPTAEALSKLLLACSSKVTHGERTSYVVEIGGKNKQDEVGCSDTS